MDSYRQRGQNRSESSLPLVPTLNQWLSWEEDKGSVGSSRGMSATVESVMQFSPGHASRQPLWFTSGWVYKLID